VGALEVPFNAFESVHEADSVCGVAAANSAVLSQDAQEKYVAFCSVICWISQRRSDSGQRFAASVAKHGAALLRNLPLPYFPWHFEAT
jgi:hypothetical protein